jgi:hypothetical protein
MLKTGVMTTVGEKVGTKVLGGIARKFYEWKACCYQKCKQYW